MTNHQQHLLTDEEKAWVKANAEKAPPVTEEEIRFLQDINALAKRLNEQDASKSA